MFSDQIAAPKPENRPSDDRWSLVLRIAESPQFQKSPRLRKFLFFICEKYIHNCPEDLKEYHIGFHVFNKPDYNPSEDNIVRVEARLLRKRLEEYFEKDGCRETLVVRIPKGSYVPVFEERTPTAGNLISSSTSVLMEMPPELELQQPAAKGFKESHFKRWMWPGIAALLAILCVVGWSRSTIPQSIPADDNSASRTPLWPMVFNQQNDTSIVCADSALVLLQDITHRPVTLADYANRDYMEKTGKLGPDVESVVSLLPGKYYTSVADLELVDRLHRLNASRWTHASIRSARNISATDFKSGNFVLLGSSRANPWVTLFEPHLNFVIRYDEQLREPLVQNRSPKVDERSIYRPDTGNWHDQDSFSTIAFLPNLTHTGEVLIIAGTSMQGTEAAGDYLFDETRSGTLLRKIGVSNHGKVPYFEALLRSGTLAGTSKDSELIAYRVFPK